MAPEPTLIISFGEHSRWLSKPDDYAGLLSCVRSRFPELEGVDIIFFLKPEWFDEEVELDESAFQHIHDKARLRIQKRNLLADPSSTRPKRLIDPAEGRLDQVQSETCRKRVKTEQNFLDLTLSPPLTSSTLPAAVPDPASDPLAGEKDCPEQKHQRSQDPPDKDVQPIPERTTLTNIRSPAASKDSIDASTASTRAEQESIGGPPQGSSSVQVQPIITSLTSKNFPVDLAAPTRAICPSRQLIPDEWVGCNKPWDDTKPSGQFSVRVLTENYTIRLIFKSKHVHFSTLLKHVLERGYPALETQFRDTSGREFHDGSCSFDSKGIKNHSDVYVFNNERPGIYLFPPALHSYDYGEGRLLETRTSVVMPSARISLHLTPELKFASLYPWAKVGGVGEKEKVEWEVCISGTGDSVSKVNQETYYGHPSWELAITADAANPSKPKEERASSSLFRRLLNPDTSVVLNWTDVFLAPECPLSSYLPRILGQQLQLPQEMILDFARYFCKYNKLARSRVGGPSQIAISFVSQAMLDEIALLKITPQPVATGRVFMLWGMVSTSKLNGPWAAWHKTPLERVRAKNNKNWAEIIGLNPVALRDRKIFRAIEWGIMLVPKEHLVGEA